MKPILLFDWQPFKKAYPKGETNTLYHDVLISVNPSAIYAHVMLEHNVENILWKCYSLKDVEIEFVTIKECKQYIVATLEKIGFKIVPLSRKVLL